MFKGFFCALRNASSAADQGIPARLDPRRPGSIPQQQKPPAHCPRPGAVQSSARLRERARGPEHPRVPGLPERAVHSDVLGGGQPPRHPVPTSTKGMVLLPEGKQFSAFLVQIVTHLMVAARVEIMRTRCGVA